MSDDRYSRRVSMQCSTCGSSAFEYEDESGPYRCKACDRTYSREELLRENGGRIESELDDAKGEIVRDLRDTLRKAFSGSKHIKFK